jgi:hypothetical protein
MLNSRHQTHHEHDRSKNHSQREEPSRFSSNHPFSRWCHGTAKAHQLLHDSTIQIQKGRHYIAWTSTIPIAPSWRVAKGRIHGCCSDTQSNSIDTNYASQSNRKIGLDLMHFELSLVSFPFNTCCPVYLSKELCNKETPYDRIGLRQ